MGATHRRGMRSEQPSKRRASTKAAAWCTVSPYRSMNFTRPTIGTERRVDLMYLNSLTVATGQEVRLDLAVAEAGQHPGLYLWDSPSRAAFFWRKSSFSMTMGLPTSRGVLHHAGHRVADESLSLVGVLAVGHQRYSPGVQVVATGVGLGHGQVVGVQVHADGATTPVGG